MTHRSLTGVGLGLRAPHVAEVAQAPVPVPFWEIAPENVVGDGSRRAGRVREILARDPVLTHGLTLSPGTVDPFEEAWLEPLSDFLLATGTPWHSEHLCFTSVDGATSHDLLPMPLTRASARHVILRVRELQARLPVPLILENITWYARLGAAELEECDWLSEVLEGADAGWLLDVNNVYVNALNHGFDPFEWLSRTPLHRVRQMHVAGHQRMGDRVIDTHGAPVIDPVARLMVFALERIGRPVPVLLERDNDIPPLAALLEERSALQEMYDQVFMNSPGLAHA